MGNMKQYWLQIDWQLNKRPEKAFDKTNQKLAEYNIERKLYISHILQLYFSDNKRWICSFFAIVKMRNVNVVEGNIERKGRWRGVSRLLFRQDLCKTRLIKTDQHCNHHHHHHHRNRCNLHHHHHSFPSIIINIRAIGVWLECASFFGIMLWHFDLWLPSP